MALGKTRRALVTGFLGLLGALAVASASSKAAPPLEGSFGERFSLLETPKPVPDAAFQTRDGESVRLADFKGQVVLLNFWATWCAPCIEEMPTLDALEADMGSPAFTVMAVSEDKGGQETVEPFLRDKLNLETLDIYLDPEGDLGRAFELRGMPTTYLIAADGRIVGLLKGGLDWNSPAVKKLIRYYVEQGRENGTVEPSG